MAGSKQFRPATRTAKETTYAPSTWRYTVQNLFREFNRGRAKSAQVRPHDLRARAITLVAAATQSIDATSEALGVDPQTARHYLDAAKAFNGSELLKKLGSVLLPATVPESPRMGQRNDRRKSKCDGPRPFGELCGRVRLTANSGAILGRSVLRIYGLLSEVLIR